MYDEGDLLAVRVGPVLLVNHSSVGILCINPFTAMMPFQKPPLNAKLETLQPVRFLFRADM